jgi:CelD/BcsL family acetyltransferase involved in cellulose biosynthesis/predicted ATP-grasp superfamily ATP-dependent carboligase
MPERILVTDVEERAVLAVCRGLESAGYLVSGVAGTKPAAGHWSRSVSRRYSLPNPRLEPDAFVSSLAAIAAEGEHAALIPGVDAALLAISERRDEFEPHLKLGLPPHDVVVRCLKKAALFAAAEAAGLGPPEGTMCASVDEAVAAAEQIGYPIAVKPARSLVGDGRILTTTFVENEDALRALAPTLGGPFIVQRRETGPVVSLGGVVAGGDLIGLCVSRYLRMWPPAGGSASSSQTFEPTPELVGELERVVGDLGWEGLFELEVIETVDGRYAAIDFNPRPYGSMVLAIESGANLPALWVDWLLGKSPSPARSRPGVRYRWEETELLNLGAAAARGDIRTAVRILKPSPGTTHAFFRIDDPAPLLGRAIGVIRSRFERHRNRSSPLAVDDGCTFETIDSAEGFEALGAEGWDELVRAMPRPSPFMLHAWLSAWWRHESHGATLAVQVARRNGVLVGALPLCIVRRRGLGVTIFLGGVHSALADLIVAETEPESTGRALAERAAKLNHDLADLFGLPAASRLAAALGERLRLVERVEAPTLDLSNGWDATYRAKTDSKKRNLHKRRRRQLSELGTLEFVRARTPGELEPALEDAVRLHEARWEGRPDGSGFATESGKRFNAEALAAFAARDAARIVTLKLDGRAIAFHYYLVFARRMYVYRLAFDPAFARFSPGLLATLDALEWAGEEGLERVEYLGGGERYKLELSDRLEPLSQGLGLAQTSRGRLYVATRLASIATSRRLKRSQRLRKLYFDGLAPARRLAARVRSGR